MKPAEASFDVILNDTKSLVGGKMVKEEVEILEGIVAHCEKKGYSPALTRVVAPFHGKVAIDAYRKAIKAKGK